MYGLGHYVPTETSHYLKGIYVALFDVLNPALANSYTQVYLTPIILTIQQVNISKLPSSFQLTEPHTYVREN
jgi:hypothetical protein